ncbi:MAG: hypothetical protein L7S56_05405 [Candidatus Poseidonia sp.]|nr:hypothetical protein [Poseidonia sp.]
MTNEEDSSKEHQNPEGTQNDDDIPEDVKEYTDAFHNFVKALENYDWPEGSPYPENQQDVRMLFKHFWSQRRRQRRHLEREHGGKQYHFQMSSDQKENFHKFIRSNFQHSLDPEDELEDIFIDPGEHQPDEDPASEEAKERTDRFKNDWE